MTSIYTSVPVSIATLRKQALQDQVLAIIKGHRVAGAAVAMGVGKTLIGLRDMERQLTSSQLSEQATKLFLVAAPTQAILDSWPQEAHKFGLAHLLDYIEFTTYSSLAKTLTAGIYDKLEVVQLRWTV